MYREKCQNRIETLTDRENYYLKTILVEGKRHTVNVKTNGNSRFAVIINWDDKSDPPSTFLWSTQVTIILQEEVCKNWFAYLYFGMTERIKKYTISTRT